MSITLINRDYQQPVDPSIQQLLDDISDFEFITPNGLLFKMSDINKTVPIYLDNERRRIEKCEVTRGELVSAIDRLEEKLRKIDNNENPNLFHSLYDTLRKLNEARERHQNSSRERGQEHSPSDKITIEKEIDLKGYYTHNGRSHCPEIVLLMETLSNELDILQSVAITLIHEMFHAFFDHDSRKNALNIPLVEEPLTEYAMLKFLEALANKDNQYNSLFNYAKNEVLSKQYSPEIAHYGFGYYLWEFENKSGKTFEDIHWIEVIRNAKYKISDSSLEYNEYSRTFRLGLYPFENEHFQMELLRVVLLNALLYANGVQLSLSGNCIPLTGYGNLPVGWEKCGLNAYRAVDGNTLYLDGDFSRGMFHHYLQGASPWDNLNIDNITQLVFWDHFICYDFFHIHHLLDEFTHQNVAVCVKVSPRNMYFVEIGGSIYDASKTTLFHCVHSAVKFDIPDGVKRIELPAFSNCISLQHLTIPSSIEIIPDGAFCGCKNLETLTFEGVNPPEADELQYLQPECDIFVPTGSKYNYEEVFPNHSIKEY